MFGTDTVRPGRREIAGWNLASIGRRRVKDRPRSSFDTGDVERIPEGVAERLLIWCNTGFVVLCLKIVLAGGELD